LETSQRPGQRFGDRPEGDAEHLRDLAVAQPASGQADAAAIALGQRVQQRDGVAAPLECGQLLLGIIAGVQDQLRGPGVRLKAAQLPVPSRPPLERQVVSNTKEPTAQIDAPTVAAKVCEQGEKDSCTRSSPSPTEKPKAHTYRSNESR
jgi:hypothetical protein